MDEDEPMPPVDGDESDDDAAERLPDLTMYKIDPYPPTAVLGHEVQARLQEMAFHDRQPLLRA